MRRRTGGARPLVDEVKRALRDLRIELSMLNQRVGSGLDLRGAELDCLDILVRHGTMTPSALARRAGVHLATMTGILNRLESAGWIERQRAENDRRSVVIKAVPQRMGEIFARYGGMNRGLDNLLAQYDDAELETIVDFLQKTTAAGRVATDEI